LTLRKLLLHLSFLCRLKFLQVRQVEAVITRICGEFESGKYWNLERGKEDTL
jgi:hypothetical protein